MMKSLYSGVSGLKTHTAKMDVIGNNIANVNTTAYKTSTVTFQDVYYQTKKSASSGTATSGGTNPVQVGYGVQLGTINQVMTQSGFNSSDNIYDCALSGEGFFQVMDEGGNIFYTRSGVFSVDNNGNLTDANGNVVLGVSGDSTGTVASSNRINLVVPANTSQRANITKEIDGSSITITAAGYGTDGNISISLVQGDSPFATLSGTNLTVEMDLTKEYASATEFSDAVNAAIVAGGIDLSDDVLPLSFEFEDIPADVSAQNAANTISATDGTNTVNFNFSADNAGAFANAYEVDMKTSTSATNVTAKWSGDILTITVPSATDYTVADIQAAITAAAGSTDKHKLTVTATDGTGTPLTTVSSAVFTAAAGTNTLRAGLTGGKNNYFANVAQLLGTSKLTNGIIGGPQTVDDLDAVVIDSNGTIYGTDAQHGTFVMGRIDIVTFENPTGLNQVSTSYWKASLASGEPEVKIAGSDGSGEIVSGALEMSNVDLSQEFSDMIITQRGFQANSRIITTSDTMLEELVNLKR